MSVLTNQTSINPTTEFFLSSGGGESTVPVLVPITQVTSTEIAAGATAIIALVPIPNQYSIGDTLIYQVAIQFQSITTTPENDACLLEVSVAFANEDDESSGNQGYYPIPVFDGNPNFKATVSFTDVRRSSAVNVAIRMRNTSTTAQVNIATLQFIRSSFQFVSANGI